MGQLLKWTKGDKDKVIRLAEKGYSTTQIAAEMGKTRNAIIGFAHRNKIKLLFGKVDREKVQTKHDAAKWRKAALEKRIQTRTHGLVWNKIKKKVKIRPPTFLAEERPFDPSQHVSFMGLQYFHCRAVIGHPDGIDTIYCGNMKMFGKSWCKHHHALYFVPPEKRVRSNEQPKSTPRDNINFR